MTTYNHVLHGCAPVPLAGYLKALGVFRLVAEQADPAARGWWHDERFVLKTTLSPEALVGFFANDYQPTPVVAPWNGGSGFWPKDNTEGFDLIRASNTDRFTAYRTAIDTCRSQIDQRGLTEAPKLETKAELLTALRATLADDACRWLDGALVLTMDGPRYPPLLGTGGNDGRLDFSNNFMRRLAQITGTTEEAAPTTLRAALFSTPSATLEKGAVGQFSPGAAGGVNAGTGFDADSRVNPWDFVLTVEGALAFAAAAVRRHANDRAAALAFPFTTRTIGAGSGSAAFADEAEARAEFWAPLWSRAASLDETLVLMAEGRAVLDGGAARDGLDFARAAAQLGVARGIDSFQRHGFLMRAGKAYFATPLGRVQVRENPRAALVSELDAGGWLSRARTALRDKEAPASRALGRRLDESLFRLAADGSADAVQRVLTAIGALTLEAGRRPKLRKTDKGQPPLPPPPRLSAAWGQAAEDGSPEFALAAALASLDAAAEGIRLPFRCHLAPLGWPKGVERWDDTTAAQALAVWGGRDVLRDMAALLERRLVEAQRHAFTHRGNPELPLRGRRTAPLAAVVAFLAGQTDDARIAALAAGLAWTQGASPPPGAVVPGGRAHAVPFAYAALKPLFAPEGVGAASAAKRMVDPLTLVRLIKAGRVPEAVTQAQRIARGAGLAAPFARRDPVPPPDAARLLAALLFPLAPKAYDRLLDRAYPDLSNDHEDTDAV